MEKWEEILSCATNCARCNNKLKHTDQRILSIYDHEAICMACKKEEEQRQDYAEASKNVIGQCMIDTELQYGDPKDFCFHHFYPFKC